MTLNNDGGPNVARIIEKALRHRLEAHARVNPERIDAILSFARENVSVRMTSRGWDVVERDVQKVFEEISLRPGWHSETCAPVARESPLQKLQRANRENRPLKRNADGSFSPAD